MLGIRQLGILAIVSGLAFWCAAPATAQCGDGGCPSVSCGDGGCETASCDTGGCHSGGCGCGASTHCGLPAPSYPVPFATPKNVTHTTFTYPPMMPHHSLPHYAGTYSFRHGPGVSRTNVHWRPTTALNMLDFLHYTFSIPR